MKVFLLMTFFMVSCVTYPRYKRGYESTPEQKELLPQISLECIDALHQQKQRDSEAAIDYCYIAALKTACEPNHYFQKVTLPFFSVTGEIPCDAARTSLEAYVCDGEGW